MCYINQRGAFTVCKYEMFGKLYCISCIAKFYKTNYALK